MKRKVLWTCVIVGLLLIVAVGVLAAYDYYSQLEPSPTPTPTPTSIPKGSFIYEGVLLGINEYSDYDEDWVSDRLEFWEYGTNPLLVDTDGDRIDDFNELFTYPHLLDPLDPTDAEAFLAMLPNIESAPWHWSAGGTEENLLTKYVEIAKRDPLVQWYAEHVVIEWGERHGMLTVNGERLFLRYRSSSAPYHLTSYYLTHGRTGVCSDAAIAHYPILELMGYECWLVSGQVESGENHVWLEANIDGEVYVVDFNFVQQVDLFYQSHSWTIAIDGKKDL